MLYYRSMEATGERNEARAVEHSRKREMNETHGKRNNPSHDLVERLTRLDIRSRRDWLCWT